MTELLTAAQMRAIEQAAIDSGEVTGLELMERAGQGVVDAILDWRPELATTSHRAVVLCGPGNNGGDGFVVARLLHQRGWEVEVYLYGNETKLPPDAAANARRWQELYAVAPVSDFDPWASRYDLGVDALFGIGLTRPLSPELYETASKLGAIQCIVAVDVPSGLCADSGRVIGEASLFAHLTVTFQYEKWGHHLQACSSQAGTLKVVDLGIDHRSSMRLLGTPYNPSTRTQADYSAIVAKTANRHLLPGFSAPRSRLDKSWETGASHKYDRGHALILSGGVGKGGAARLAARGTLRIGAGLVTVGCPPSALIENAARLDAIMLASIKDADVLAAEIADRKIKALCIGPGFGTGERLRAFLETGLQPGLPMVLDADALTEYREDPETLFAMLHEGCVLTPHEGEFGRLFPDILDKLKAPATRGPAYSKVDATREAAKRAGCTVLFKGADTVIADPNGRCAINSAHYERAAPWLATAGSGDVLAGFITGLMARGFDPMQAAETAAWLHVECARKFGPGLIAEDLPEQLPAVFRDLDL
ncbi:MAG: NAD(P)H-hydrate dehydratase [Pseudomonadota bacterium]